MNGFRILAWIRFVLFFGVLLGAGIRLGLVEAETLLNPVITPKDFNGTWRLVEVQSGAEFLDDDKLDVMEFVARDGGFLFYYEGASNHGRFRFRPNTDPQEVDWYEEVGNDPNTWRLSLVRRVGADIQVCYGIPGGTRPTGFSSSAENPWLLVTYRRKPGLGTPPDRALKVLVVDQPGLSQLAGHVVETIGRSMHAVAVRHAAGECTGAEVEDCDAVVHCGDTASGMNGEAWRRFELAHVKGLTAVLVQPGGVSDGGVPRWTNLWGAIPGTPGVHNVVTTGTIAHGVTLGLKPSSPPSTNAAWSIGQGRSGFVPLWLAGPDEVRATNVIGWIHEAHPYRVFATSVPLKGEALLAVSRAIWWGIGRLDGQGRPLAGFERTVMPLNVPTPK